MVLTEALEYMVKLNAKGIALSLALHVSWHLSYSVLFKILKEQNVF